MNREEAPAGTNIELFCDVCHYNRHELDAIIGDTIICRACADQESTYDKIYIPYILNRNQGLL